MDIEINAGNESNVMTIRSKFNSFVAKPSPFPLGLEIVSSHGVYLRDGEGKAYIDFISGIGVSNLGHGHPEILQAIHTQTDLYLHTMVYGEHIHSPQVLLAELLISKLPDHLSQVYFLSSGTEAIETAMKLARKTTQRTGILSCENAYHGSTYGALSLMSDTSKTTPYAPNLPGVSHIIFNDFQSLDMIDTSVAAVIIELIQAESGIWMANREWLKALLNKCKQHEVLIIVDEIQSAMGRSGSLFAMDEYDFKPDILVLGKSLGGGMPLAACISSSHMMQSLSDDPPLTHMTTFGGHPLCCAAGLAALQILTNTDIVQNSKGKALRFVQKLNHPLIKSIRTTGGLWLAIDFEDAELVQKLMPIAQDQGLLIDWFLFNDQSIRIAPPLTINDDELDQAADILIRSLDLISVSHSVMIP